MLADIEAGKVDVYKRQVRPKVTELLSPNPADYILDIACGNGNYSSYLAQDVYKRQFYLFASNITTAATKLVSLRLLLYFLYI